MAALEETPPLFLYRIDYGRRLSGRFLEDSFPASRKAKAGWPTGGSTNGSCRAMAWTFAGEISVSKCLIDNARRKRAIRHGGGQQRVDLGDQDIAVTADDDQLLAINEALDKLAAQDKQKAELVKLRFFVGLTIEQAAEILDISAPTAKRHWTFSRAWLHREMEKHIS